MTLFECECGKNPHTVLKMHVPDTASTKFVYDNGRIHFKKGWLQCETVWHMQLIAGNLLVINGSLVLLL